MTSYHTIYTEKNLKNSLQKIQDIIYWLEWLNQIGKVGEIGDKKWKSIKKEIIDYLVILQNSISEIEYNEFSKLEFHFMLKNILKKVKHKIYQIKKENYIHKNDFNFILSILKGLTRNNKKIIQDIEETQVVSGVVGGTFEED
jgi:hypothetical protein